MLRILDANLNRAREGLRVAEEYARFALEIPALSRRLKELRHGLAGAAHALEKALRRRLDAARDTPGDIGVGLSTAAEKRRRGPADAAAASMKRLQEALRALEEYAKAAGAGAVAGRFARLRYAAYAIEPALFADADRRLLLREARLYVLVTGALASTDPLTAAREAVDGGADIIQLREKEMEDGAFLRLASRIQEVCRRRRALFLVNDRVAIAALGAGDGVHTGQGDLPTHLARRIIGPDRLIGRSTSAPAFARAAMREGADYVGIGPVWATATKRHRAPAGLGYVRWAARNLADFPYFCIGAVGRGTLDEVLDAGGRAVAVCTAIIGAKDIAAEAAWFKARLRERTDP